jgi:hypothetical protein
VDEDTICNSYNLVSLRREASGVCQVEYLFVKEVHFRSPTPNFGAECDHGVVFSTYQLNLTFSKSKPEVMNLLVIPTGKEETLPRRRE